MKEQCKQDVLSASILLKQRRDIKGGRPLLPPQYAGMAELADALDLGSSGKPCRFDSCYPHQRFQSCGKTHTHGCECASSFLPCLSVQNGYLLAAPPGSRLKRAVQAGGAADHHHILGHQSSAGGSEASSTYCLRLDGPLIPAPPNLHRKQSVPGCRPKARRHSPGQEACPPGGERQPSPSHTRPAPARPTA